MTNMGDRGLMKWNGFIMPEQKELIRQIYTESLKTEKPILDEEQLHKMNDLLVRSMQDNEQITLKLWVDGFIKDFGPVTIYKIDPVSAKLICPLQKHSTNFSF